MCLHAVVSTLMLNSRNVASNEVEEQEVTAVVGVDRGVCSDSGPESVSIVSPVPWRSGKSPLSSESMFTSDRSCRNVECY